VRHEVEPSWGPILLEQMQSDGFFSRLPTEVVVRTKSGAEHRRYTEYALGDPWSAESTYSDDQVAAKARQYLEAILPASRIEDLVKAVEGLETATDVSAIVEAMVA
jgi:hypothetical protein